MDAELVFETGRFSYADAEHMSDLWIRAYPVMREITTGSITALRDSIEAKSWEVDPSHPQAEALRRCKSSEEKLRRRLKLTEELRRVLGQLDRGTHKLCTRSGGSWSVTGAYMAVRHLLDITSLSQKGLGDVYRLAAALAEAEERVNEDRAAWHRERTEKEKEEA